MTHYHLIEIKQAYQHLFHLRDILAVIFNWVSFYLFDPTPPSHHFIVSLLISNQILNFLSYILPSTFQLP